MKRATALVAGALLIFSGSAHASGELKSDFFSLGGAQMPPKFNEVTFWTDSVNNGVFFSTDPFDPRVSETNKKHLEQSFRTVLGVCDAELSSGCIESVQYNMSGEWKDAQLLASPGQRDVAFGTISKDSTWDIVKTSTYPANPAKGIFRASQPNLFQFSGADHRLGNNYWVNAVLTSELKDGKALIRGLDISAWGTKIDSSCRRGGDMTFVETSAGGYCNYLTNLPATLSIRVSINLGSRLKELSGWFDGRILNPDIDLGVSKSGVLTVEGSPIEVSSAITKLVPKGDPLYSVDAQTEKMQGEHGTNRLTISRDGGFREWQRLSSKVQDTAASTNTYWRLSSWVDGSQGRYGCNNASGVLGVVFTNAIAYTPGAPILDKSTGSLKFQVAAPHLTASGAQNVGFYDLLVKDSVAKCIWGSSFSANQAQISVLNNDGTSQVATTTFAMSKGWAKFKAYGYHYSAPSISVKFAKPAPAKKTIVCVKGKTSKMVTAVAPKCPAGFKKK